MKASFEPDLEVVHEGDLPGGGGDGGGSGRRHGDRGDGRGAGSRRDSAAAVLAEVVAGVLAEADPPAVEIRADCIQNLGLPHRGCYLPNYKILFAPLSYRMVQVDVENLQLT